MDGRRHRRDAPYYLLPKDEKEIQRLDYQHFILRQVLEGNTYAPVDKQLCKQGSNVLDVGCGTGRWGYEIALAYPSSTVIGFDLEEVQRTGSPPPNYQFYRGDILQGLPFAGHTFTYVHQRLLVAAIPANKWPEIIGELKRVTVPGGWVELIEMGTTFHHAGPATLQFLAWWKAISESRGIDASLMSQLGLLLQGANLRNVTSTIKEIPVGSWGGRVGRLFAQDILAGWPTIRPLAQTVLNVSPVLFNEVLASLEAEWNSEHTSYEVYCHCGQR